MNNVIARGLSKVLVGAAAVAPSITAKVLSTAITTAGNVVLEIGKEATSQLAAAGEKASKKHLDMSSAEAIATAVDRIKHPGVIKEDISNAIADVVISIKDRRDEILTGEKRVDSDNPSFFDLIQQKIEEKEAKRKKAKKE